MANLKQIGDFGKDFQEGFVEGVNHARNRILNGMTLGGYDKLNTFLGGNSENLENKLKDEAESAGLGGAFSFASGANEFLGNMIPSAKLINIARKTGAGAVGQMALAGGTEEAIREGINSDKLSEIPTNAAIGGVKGSVIGGALGGTLNVLTSGVNLLRNDLKKGITYLNNELGTEALQGFIDEAKSTGRSLAEIVNKTALNLAQKARQQTPKARDIIAENVETIKKNAVNKADVIMDDIFTTQQGWKTAEDVKEAADHASGQIFKGLYAIGDISPYSPKIKDFIKNNDLVRTVIGQVKSDVRVPKEIRKLPYTDMEILERARQRLGEMESQAVQRGEKAIIKDITKAKNDFLNTIYEGVPQYQQALGIYEQAHKLREAVDMSSKVFKRGINPDKFAQEFNKLEGYEKDALKLGLKDKIYEIIGNSKSTGGWKALTYENVKKKIKTVLGEEEAKKLIDFANHEVRKYGNFNHLVGNSETASRLNMSAPSGWINTALDVAKSLGDLGRHSRNRGVAEIMTNPSSEIAEKALKSVDNPTDKILMRYFNATPELLGLADLIAKDWK